MPHLFTYHIFISHAWRYSDDMFHLVSLLKGASNFSFYDYSITQEKSLTDDSHHIPDSEITAALSEQIRHASVVIVLLGMYTNYHEWIEKELAIARAQGKYIIGVKPWGQKPLPFYHRSLCNEVVGWNTDSIVDAIRRAHHLTQ